MSNAFIPLSVPNFSGKEKEYVNAAVLSEWVSSGGSLVARFEEELAAYAGVQGAVACASGTAGLHLALLVAGVGPGQEVIAPTLTFIAAVNPIRYVGAQPVLLGCDDSLCIDPDAVEDFCQNQCHMQDGALVNRSSKRRVTAILPVHVFGNLANMQKLCAIAKKYGLAVIEDATEALGSRYTAGPFAGSMAGSMGDVGVYSFNGNKIITTGSGGMLISRHQAWLARAKHLSAQAKTDEVFYTHDEVGYNYRMANLPAALGLAQLEQLEGFIARKQQIYAQYAAALHGRAGLCLLPFREGTRSNHWFFSLYLQAYPLSRSQLIARLQADGIQTRSIWGLIHQQAPYRQAEVYTTEKAQDYHDKVVNLPCSTNLQNSQIQRVCQCILAYAGEK